MTLDLSELMEPSVPKQRQRQPLASSVDFVAGPVDKPALLEAFDSEIELVEAQAQAQSRAMAVAHDEDVSAWASAIARWMEQRDNAEAISLVQLQQELRIPMVEVWLGLLLSDKHSFLLEQRSEFYTLEGVWVKILSFCC